MINIPDLDDLLDNNAGDETPKATLNPDSPQKVTEGGRNSWLTSMAGTMRRRGFSVESMVAALLLENQAKCEPPLPEKEILSIARSVARYEPQPPYLAKDRLTDVGNGRRFARQWRGTVKYSHERGEWLIWSGKVWQWDVRGDAKALAKATARTIYKEVTAEQDENRRRALARHAARSESDARLTAMLNLAKSEDGIPVVLAELDADEFLFNCDNGVIDLKTGNLLPHDPAYLMTKISPVKFDPNATAEIFDNFISWAMSNDVSRVRFLQRFFGYSMTASVVEHALIFCTLLGGNGKSTLLKLAHRVLGDYAMMAAPNLLLAKRNDQHPTELADLFGKRLACTIEIEAGRRFDVAQLKWLTGGDPLKGRFMRQDVFDFYPSHKFAIAANHQPNVRDNTTSFWRRMRVVPFHAQVTEENRDTGLDDKLWTEAPGVLAWMVRGCLEWQRNGLGQPDAVRDATKRYQNDQDWLNDFLSECCTQGDGFECSVKSLYERAKTWWADNGEKILTKQVFNRLMRERGFKDEPKTNNELRWQGVRII